MCRLNSEGQPEFYFRSEANHDNGYTISTEELLLLAKEAKTIGEFRVKLIMECLGTTSEERVDYLAQRKAAGL